LTNDIPDVSSRPLDHATARIVAELAAALLPPLTAEMKESVAAEVAVRLNQTADELARQSSAQFAAFSSALASVKPVIGDESLGGSIDETLQEIAGLLRFLKEAIPGWEGVLKADGRMQTRELSEFSAEMSELVKDMKLNLAAAARESAEKAAARDGERRRLLEESGRTTESRLARLEKLVILTGAVSAFLWAALLLALLV
jgi:hypothetical protein